MKQVVRNAGWGGFSAAFRAVYGLLNVLLAVRLLGAENYGHLATLLAMFVFYTSICTSMFTMLVVKVMASSADADEKAALLASGWLWTAGSLCFLALACSVVILLGIFDILPEGWGFGSENVSLLFALSLLSAMQILGAFQFATMESAGRLDLAIKTQMLGPMVVLAFLFISALSAAPFSPLFYAWVLCIGATVDFALAWGFRRRVLQVNLANVSLRNVPSRLGQLLKSGGMFQATLLMNMFLEPFNKMLLNSVLGGAAVTIYDLAMKIIWGILSLFSAATRVFLHLSSQDRAVVESSYLKVIRLFCVPAVLIHVIGCLFLVGLGQYWLALDTRQLALFFAVATISNLGMIAVMPLYNGLIGAEEMRFLFKTQAILAVTNVVASLCLIPILGVTGAAFGLLLATAYNAAAILRKSESMTGSPDLIGRAVRSLNPRLTLAGLLFCLAVYCGINPDVARPLGLAVLLGAGLMAVREPVTAQLFSAIGQRTRSLNLP